MWRKTEKNSARVEYMTGCREQETSIARGDRRITRARGPNRQEATQQGASGSKKNRRASGSEGRVFEELEELQECREVDNGVAESTGGANGRRRNPPALPEGSNRGRGVTGGTTGVPRVRQWCSRVERWYCRKNIAHRSWSYRNGVESMVTDNGGDAGTGLQECR